MKKILFIIVCMLIVGSGCNKPVDPALTSQLTGDTKTDMENMLPEGKIKINIMGIKQSQRQKELMKKFQEGIQKNQQWFIEYLKTVPTGQALPYHPNIGLTEMEHNELLGYLNNLEFVLLSKEDATIHKVGGTITLKFMGKLATTIGEITINEEKNTVTIGEFILPFERNVDVKDETTPLKSKWRGYTWSLKDPKNIDLENLTNLQKLKAKQYEFTIGRLEKNGNTFINVKGREIKDGVKTVNFDVPLILDLGV